MCTRNDEAGGGWGMGKRGKQTLPPPLPPPGRLQTWHLCPYLWKHAIYCPILFWDAKCISLLPINVGRKEESPATCTERWELQMGVAKPSAAQVLSRPGVWVDGPPRHWQKVKAGITTLGSFSCTQKSSYIGRERTSGHHEVQPIPWLPRNAAAFERR